MLFVESKDYMWKGFMYAICMLLVAQLQTICLHTFSYVMYTLGLNWRTALVSAIYKKFNDKICGEQGLYVERYPLRNQHASGRSTTNCMPTHIRLHHLQRCYELENSIDFNDRLCEEQGLHVERLHVRYWHASNSPTPIGLLALIPTLDVHCWTELEDFPRISHLQ
ncbi:hypothetical protein J6590_020925 [Homalodisca vitripennis]|nr:hypothetical protein J6590_020925 [Homalodisca vitripennis]